MESVQQMKNTNINQLKVVANELVPVYVTDSGEKIVEARELHEFLEVGTKFTDWIKERIRKYGFVENEDYLLVLTKSGERQNVIKHDYILKLDVAKELAMLEDNEQGREARKYFINIEKQFKELRLQFYVPSYQIDDPIARAQRWIEEQKEKQALEKQLEEAQPMIEFTKTVLKSDDTILVRELAKIAQKDGLKIGEKKLYQKLREWGLVLKNSTEPSQKAMNQELLVVEEKLVINRYGNQILTRTTKVTAKGQVYIINKLKKEMNTSK